MRFRRWQSLLIVIAGAIAHPAGAQVHKFAELNTEQIAALDRSRTVVILTGGIMEEHGPYLPSFSDGYLNEWLTQQLAEAIVAKPGWRVVLFPTIPLGVGGANEIGGKHVFPGTYAVRSTTLRAVFMDLATEFGEQGFKWIFVVHAHGAPRHNRVLDQAGDYFQDTYGGRMVNLTGLILPEDEPGEDDLTESGKREEGFSVHAGAWETSTVLFLRPDLVGPIATAPLQTAETPADMGRLAAAPGWPGYFGSPRLGTASLGARASARSLKPFIEFALAVLNGTDDRKVPSIGRQPRVNPGDVAYDRRNTAREEDVEKKQQAWLRAHPDK
jgi:creatinine amidohydrolase/Fe(II)-dependent formamide hydrolase-like protein